MKLKSKSFAFVLTLLVSACGTNVFEKVDKPDPADKAAALLDENKVDEAIRVLEDGLKDEPENWQLFSLMGSALAQKAGISTIDIVLNLAEEKSNSEAEGNALTAMFSILPPATAERCDFMKKSVDYLAAIPETARISSDIFKITLFNAAFTSLQAKLFDSDGDGKFTEDELRNLDEEAAIAILESLINAEGAAAQYTADDTTGKAAEKIAEIKSQIDAQPGSTDSEKLKHFLESQFPNGTPNPP